MRVSNNKVNTAIEKLDKLDSLNYGYYLDTYNSRPDLSSKKYHLYIYKCVEWLSESEFKAG